MVADPFFCLKFAHLKAMYGKFGPPDPADLATTNPLAVLATSHNGLGNRWHIAAAQKKNSHQNRPAVAYRRRPLGISHGDIRDMPTVGPTIARSATVGEFANWMPSRNKIRRIW
jgi:hypothetical protein